MDFLVSQAVPRASLILLVQLMDAIVSLLGLVDPTFFFTNNALHGKNHK